MPSVRRTELPDVRGGAMSHTDQPLSASTDVDGDRWLRCRDVAELLAISERQVWRLAQTDGRSPASLEPTRIRMPGRKRPLTRWRWSDVQRFLASEAT